MRHHPSKQNIVWTVLFSLLTALTLNACSDSNNVSGPPAPIPLSPDAKLLSLTVNPGPLQPAFSSDGTNYTVDVSTTVTSVTVTAQPQTAGATANINGQVTTNRSVTLGAAGAAGSITVVTIVVTAPSGSQNTYIVIVNRAGPASDNNLSALSVTGQTLTPAFSASQQDYTVNVATTVTQVNVSATKSDPNAVMSGSVTAGAGVGTGQAAILLGGAPSSTPIRLLVAAQIGPSKTYSVTVNRAAPAGNNNLSSLVVSAGALVPAFDASILNYDVAVPNTTADTIVTATVEDSTAALAINGSPAISGVPSPNILLAVGPSSIPVIVTAGNGTPKTYTVMITRDP
jgi:Cadherin-like beta sandwich domain